MQKKLVGSQLNNWKTYEMYKRQCLTLAENVFEFENLPLYVDTAFLNKSLLRNGSIAFFKDDELGLIALPYIIKGTLDIYARPKNIQAYAPNGSYRIDLKQGDFVIMYDNNGRYPLYLDILQYSERLAQITRTIDINVAQQKTSRFWKTKEEKLKSVQDIINNVDGYENIVLTYDNIDLDDTTIVLEPAPYVTDKLDLEKEKIWNEFLRLIGISNLSYMKKERNISDEINAMQGGTIASRFSRFEPRKKACEQIKEKFGIDIKVKYYDGVPSSIDDFEEKMTMKEVDNNVSE